MTPAAPSKRALCVGICDYPGKKDDLDGSVNDAKDWAGLLESQYGFTVKLLLDAEATRGEVLDSLEEMVTSAKPGDVLVFTFSGHGTWVLDRNGDEADGRDEAIGAHDDLIIDDDFRRIFSKLGPGVSLSVICDACHSGTITDLTSGDPPVSPRAIGAPDPGAARAFAPEGAPAASRPGVQEPSLPPESPMNHVLLASCRAIERSYDRPFDGRYNGALTHFALQFIRANPGQTWADLHAALCRLLPCEQFPQSPQLEGPDTYRNRPIFT